MKTKVILISSKKKGGKDALGCYAVKELEKQGLSTKVYHFADPLKRFCIDYLYLPENLVYGTDEDKETLTQYAWEDMPHYKDVLEREIRLKEQNSDADFIDNGSFLDVINKFSGLMTIRQVLQEVGTGWFRKLDFDYWVNRTIKEIQKDGCDIAIVCDCRFPNEIGLPVEHFGKENSLRVRLMRSSGKNDTHPSETALDDYAGFDEILDNRNQRLETSEDCFLLLIQNWLKK